MTAEQDAAELRVEEARRALADAELELQIWNAAQEMVFRDQFSYFMKWGKPPPFDHPLQDEDQVRTRRASYADQFRAKERVRVDH